LLDQVLEMSRLARNLNHPTSLLNRQASAAKIPVRQRKVQQVQDLRELGTCIASPSINGATCHAAEFLAAGPIGFRLGR